MELASWFHVNFDQVKIILNVHAPDGEPQQEEINWQDISRICYRAKNHLQTDELEIFTAKQSTSYLIPVEADGGFDLWNEIVRRELFDPNLAIRISLSSKGVFYWPEKQPQPK